MCGDGYGFGRIVMDFVDVLIVILCLNEEVYFFVLFVILCEDMLGVLIVVVDGGSSDGSCVIVEWCVVCDLGVVLMDNLVWI